MDYKEKYEQALERAQKLQENSNGMILKKWLWGVFPELKENGDERIRKEIIDFLELPHPQFVGKRDHEKWIAWLEKQGKKKSADKPKFKVGDWIVFNGLTLYIKEVVKGYYITKGGIITNSYDWDIDNAARLWTIQDAKDGDVLASEDKDKIFLYNGKLDLRGRACAYCGIYKTYDGLRFAKCTVGNYFTYKEPYPTTKEQRDTLFAKMADAGYEWDSEKKEVKKVEPKNPIVNVPPRELILSIWDLGNEWKELTNGSSSTEYGTQLEYIQKHWQESSYYDNIGDNIPTLTDKDYDKLFINCKH